MPIETEVRLPDGSGSAERNGARCVLTRAMEVHACLNIRSGTLSRRTLVDICARREAHTIVI